MSLRHHNRTEALLAHVKTQFLSIYSLYFILFDHFDTLAVFITAYNLKKKKKKKKVITK